MSRTVTAAQHAAVASLDAELHRLALEISHPDITDNVRVVADRVDHSIEGNTYQAVRFSGVLPNDQEGQVPQASLRIDNVGRPLIEWIEASNGGRGASVRLMVVQHAAASDIVWEITMKVGRIVITAEHVTVTLTKRKLLGRPAVKIRHDPRRSPGLF